MLLILSLESLMRHRQDEAAAAAIQIDEPRIKSELNQWMKISLCLNT